MKNCCSEENLFVTLQKHLWRSNSKILLYKIYYPSVELFRCQKLLHAFQTFRTIVRSNPSLLPLRKTQKKFVDLTCSISLLSDNLQLMNLWTRERFTVSMSNLSYIPMVINTKLHGTPKLMQRHYKLSKVERNRMNNIIFFFCKIICL